VQRNNLLPMWHVYIEVGRKFSSPVFVTFYVNMVLVVMIMAQVLGSESRAHKGYSFLNTKPGVAWQLPVELPMSVVHCSTFGHYAMCRCKELMTVQ